jgi:hypothetical protein
MITPDGDAPSRVESRGRELDTAEVKAIESGHDARVYMLAFYLEAR